MPVFRIPFRICSLGTLAACVACSTITIPSGAGTERLSNAIRGTGARIQPIAGGSWMDVKAKKQSLLYVSDTGTDSVLVFTYPTGKQVGTLRGFNGVEGMCVDKTGDVWIMSVYDSKYFGYRHGGTQPIATLSDSYGTPSACAFDPSTGNFAVANIGGANVVVYKRGPQGSPKSYENPSLDGGIYFVGYDSSGNLFADGRTGGSGKFGFAELRRGGRKLQSVSLGGADIGWPGNVQWDGRYVAVGDQQSGSIFRFDVKGSTGKLVDAISFDGTAVPIGFFIDGNVLLAPAAGSPYGGAGFWHYPFGGTPDKMITKGLYYPDSMVISNP